MKRIKPILILLCVLALLAGSVTCVLMKRTPLPAQREVLIEPVPAANPLRLSEEVKGVGESRFFIQSPNKAALQTVSVAQFGADPALEDNAAALNRAFAYCKEHPGTRLQFDKAVYYVSDRLI
ncbi:MAG: hypothetical protein IK080_10435, partial [Clostridia bacterium]|nr:hypothetical protein [Clostridia bacterium]